MINPKITGNYLSLKPLVNFAAAGSGPVDWRDYFGRKAKLEVEIGFGLGDFLVRNAGGRADTDFVGIESGWPLIKRALRKIGIARLTNVRLLLRDARIALRLSFREKSVSVIYALFPCPWPKKRHARHRLFDNDFFKILNSRLTDDGFILIVTDHEEYFGWLQSQVSGTGFLCNTEKIGPQFDTKYERKWNSNGKELFHKLHLVKERHISLRQGQEITLISRTAASFDPERFHPTGLRGHFMIETKDFLYDEKQKRAMLRLVISEDDLLQDIWIEIQKQERGWQIKPARGCGFIPTKGMQAAMDHVKVIAEASAI